MADIIRDAPLGQFLRFVTRNRVLLYPEEKPGFKLPDSYVRSLKNEKELVTPATAETLSTDSGSIHSDTQPYEADVELAQPMSHLSRTLSKPYTQERLDHDREHAIQKSVSRPIAPVKTSDGSVLVDWYETDDQENPQNWSAAKKGWIAFLVCVYTFVVYTGSAIYTSSELGVMSEFGIGATNASLPLALYVLAYGIGPLIFAPLSELPAIGRSPVYIGSFLIFTIVSIPAGFVNNFGGLLVIRFLQGFFGSPCLANGAASMQDVFSFMSMPYALIAWVSAAYCGPALGPLLSGFAVTSLGWRWSLYEIAIAAVPVLFLMFALLPETSTPTLLRQRAMRLRKLTGDDRLQTQAEIDNRNLKVSSIFITAMIKPLEITIKDPAIAFVNVYTAIVYGIYYSFFEVFPLVYPVYYDFSIGMIGVVFTCVLVACLIGVVIYVIYLKYYMIPDMLQNGTRAQEHRLIPALIASFGPTVGLFLFAWLADTHWIAPTISITIYGATVFIVMQCIFTYVPMSYPQYAASLFAANDFFRSAFAFSSILFARPMYLNLGVAKGTSLLGGLSTLGIAGMFGLYFFGAKLRARSKFAVKN